MPPNELNKHHVNQCFMIIYFSMQSVEYRGSMLQFSRENSSLKSRLKWKIILNLKVILIVPKHPKVVLSTGAKRYYSLFKQGLLVARTGLTMPLVGTNGIILNCCKKKMFYVICIIELSLWTLFTLAKDIMKFLEMKASEQWESDETQTVV